MPTQIQYEIPARQSIRRIDLAVDEEVVLEKNELVESMELLQTATATACPNRCTVILHISTHNINK